MPKKVSEKSAVEVKRLSKVPGLHNVGGVAGLYLSVGSGQACSWILKTVVGDKRREFGLGSYPEISLKKAREEATRLKAQIKKGKDPLAKKQRARDRLKGQQAKLAKRLTFREAAIRCHRARAEEFKNARHRNNWLRSLEMYAFPLIGDVSIANLETAHVVSTLEPIWQTKTETADKVRQRMEAVWSWAKVGGYCKGDNPVRWRGHLDQVLPAPSKFRKRKHHAALPWEDIPHFIANLRQREGVSARALEFAVLTAARSGEVRLATWEEVDLRRRLWTVPAGRMKSGKEHRVPLNPQAIRILRKQSNNLPYLFTAPKLGPLSDMSLSAITRRMGVDAVPHGICRSSFKDWARAATTYADEISELALAHVGSDATRAAYARDDLLTARRKLMNAWGEFCDGRC